MSTTQRCLIDTNVFLVGALDLRGDKSSEEAKIVSLAIERKIIPVLSLRLLSEYHESAKRVVGKDFAGWLRHLILDVSKPVFVSDELCKEIEPKFSGLIPKEDLRHFVSCIVAEADYLISNNREFLKKAKNSYFECLTPKEFLNKAKLK
ncbi:PIN domain-containing protein [Candidatus Woesearchaeota archaeon]|nr:PIN domain-containing protein [Candidatus Woesearchaeota archaeon]